MPMWFILTATWVLPYHIYLYIRTTVMYKMLLFLPLMFHLF
nr:MAG TPA_asm: hypothetical protein [Caudoviricetes sp.]